MKDNRERIKFAIEFMNKDLTGLSAKRWHGMQADLYSFLMGTPLPSVVQPEHAFRGWGVDPLTPFSLASAQGLLRYLVHEITAENWRLRHKSAPPWADERLQVDPTTGNLGYTTIHGPQFIAVRRGKTKEAKEYYLELPVERATVRFTLHGPGAHQVQFLRTTLTDAMLLALGDALTGVEVSYLRRCPACLQVFFADDKRQDYCSSRCASRARMRRRRTATGKYRFEPAPGDPDFQFDEKPAATMKIPKKRKEQ